MLYISNAQKKLFQVVELLFQKGLVKVRSVSVDIIIQCCLFHAWLMFLHCCIIVSSGWCSWEDAIDHVQYGSTRHSLKYYQGKVGISEVVWVLNCTSYCTCMTSHVLTVLEISAQMRFSLLWVPVFLPIFKSEKYSGIYAFVSEHMLIGCLCSSFSLPRRHLPWVWTCRLGLWCLTPTRNTMEPGRETWTLVRHRQ